MSSGPEFSVPSCLPLLLLLLYIIFYLIFWISFYRRCVESTDRHCWRNHSRSGNHHFSYQICWSVALSNESGYHLHFSLHYKNLKTQFLGKFCYRQFHIQVTRGISEFKPTPSENRDFCKKSYNVPYTLLVLPTLSVLHFILKKLYDRPSCILNVSLPCFRWNSARTTLMKLTCLKIYWSRVWILLVAH